MTIREFYEWAVENGIENFKMFNDGAFGVEEYTTEHFRIEPNGKIYNEGVYTNWER